VAVDFPSSFPGYRDLEVRGSRLLQIGRSLVANVRSDDAVGWMGGGLFAWILRGASDFTDFEAAERVREALVRHLGDEPMTFTTSVCEQLESDTPDRLLWRACVALRWAALNGAEVTFRWSPDAVQALSDLVAPTE
jgi:GGDEF domain-containing protein